MILVAGFCTTGIAAQAGGLSDAIMEPEVATPEVPFDPPQGSISGGYILLGAFVIMSLIAASN